MKLTSLHPRFRTVTAGRETLHRGYDLPRHRHLAAYALVVISGAFEQTSYAGRVVARAGDLLVQPTLDCHANRLLTEAQILRLPWTRVDGLGSVYRLSDLDGVVRLAERDARQAGEMAACQIARSSPVKPPHAGWPDLLASDIAGGRLGHLSGWALAHGLAVETISRGFARVYGVPPLQFHNELRARDAWIRVIRTTDRLATIAAETGFADQAHMTRHIVRLTGMPPARWRQERGVMAPSAPHDVNGHRPAARSRPDEG